RRYVYSDVPREVAETFRAAFSKGIYFNARIRNSFPCREIRHQQSSKRATQSQAARATIPRMIPMKTSTVFKNRWMALLWAAGIIWFAYDYANSQPQK